MAPVNKIRTYRPSSTINNSVDAFNALLAKNMTKRLIDKKRKKMIPIKILPANVKTMLTDDSLQVSTEDTFDKLRRGITSNPVKQKDISSNTSQFDMCNINSKKNNLSSLVSNSSSTNNKSRSVHKKKSNLSSLISNSSSTSNKLKSVNNNFSFSPPMTRFRANKVSYIQNSNKSDPFAHIFQEPTVTKLNSLEIESETKKPDQQTLSYLHIPQSHQDFNKTETSYNNIFSNSFRDKQDIHCSTPLFPVAKKMARVQTCPPTNMSSLFQKSIEVIKEWDTHFPDDNRNEVNVSLHNEPNSQSYMSPEFINLRKRKIIKNSKSSNSSTVSSKAKSLTVSLDDFNAFENSTNIPNENLFQASHFTHSNYEHLTNANTPLNFVTNRRKKKFIITRRFSESSISNMSKKVEENRRNSVDSISLAELSKVNQKYSCHFTSCSNNSTLEKKVCINIKRLPDIENRLKNIQSSHSLQSFEDFHSAFSKKCSEEYRIDKELFIRLTRAEKNFEEFYIKNYSSSFENDICDKISCDEHSIVLEDCTPKHDNIKDKLFVNITNRNIQNDIPPNQTSLDEISYNLEESIHPTSNSTQCETTQDHFINESLNVSQQFVNNQNRTSHSTDLFRGFSATHSLMITPRKTEDSGLKDAITIQKSKETNQMSSTRQQRFSEHENQQESPNDPSKLNTLNINSSRETTANNLTEGVLKTSPRKSTGTANKLREHVLNTSPSRESGNNVNKSISTVILRSGVSHNDSSNIIESSIIDLTESDEFKAPRPKKTLLMKPGKLWRRSFLVLRKNNLINQLLQQEAIRTSFNTNDEGDFSKRLARESQFLRRSSIRIVPIKPVNVTEHKNDTTLLESYALNPGYVPQQQIHQEILENSFANLSLSLVEKNNLLENPLPVTAKEIVLRKCEQAEPLFFQKCYPESILQHCHKVGEGVYGEVFLFKNPEGGTSVIKIIPIEGEQIVNGERQKKFDEILSEIVIAKELSSLRYRNDNSTTTFNEVQQIKCVQGSYPKRLVELWDLFDETQGSENDCPDIFEYDQLYMVLQLSHGGRDLESYVFNNAMQAYAMFEQVAFALAVAENELNFEHRDLHWGNVLLLTVEKNKIINYTLKGKSYTIPTRGVEASIIDFTLSRIEHDGVVLYNDLCKDDELFAGVGDYQFEVYRLMRDKNGNEWQHFEPYTNLIWLHYIVLKAISALRYKNPRTKIHKEYTAKLKLVSNEILKYKGAMDFVLNYLV